MIKLVKEIFKLSALKDIINICKLNFINRKKNITLSLGSKVRDCNLESNINVLGETELNSCKVGRGTYIGDGGRFNHVQIGRFCSIAKNVQVVVGNHPTKDFISTHPMFYLSGNNVIQQMGLESLSATIYNEISYAKDSNYVACIGNDVWIGQNVIIINGVTIGNGAIIASGAVVTRDVAPYSIVAGVPAKLIRKRFEEDIINDIESSRWWDKDISSIMKNINSFQNYKSFKKMISESENDLIKRNAFSNFIGRLWGIFSLFTFVPFYIHYLGNEGFGYIGFYNTLIALLAFADLGFSAATTREFARFSKGTSEDENNRANLLRTYEILYLILCFLLSIGIYTSAQWVANDWLLHSNNNIDTTHLILLMGISVVLQLPSNLYIGALMGGEKQVLANVLQIIWGLLRTALVLPVLHFSENKLDSFFVWQIICNVIFLISLYLFTWHSIRFSKRGFKSQVLKDTYRYALGMAFIGILSAIATQADKLIISKKFTIDIVGQYSLAATLSLIPLILITTLAKAIFPKLTRIKEKGNREELNDFYLRLSKLACIMVLPLSITLASYSFDIVYIWTNSTQTAQNLREIVYFLLLAQAIQALTVIPFHLTLSFAYIRVNLVFCILIMLLVPLFYFSWFYIYQANGVAFSVLMTVLVIFIPYMYFVHKHLTEEILFSWLKYNILSIIIAAAATFMMKHYFYIETNNVFFIGVQAFWMGIICLLCVSFTVGIKTWNQVIALLRF